MITSPLLSAVRSSQHGGGAGGGARELGSGGADLPWQSGLSGNLTGGGGGKACFHSIPPSDPLRQANRLPIKVLKMLTARTGHILHPEYLQPLPSTPVSPIELDAKKSPLALLAQTCSQIGKPDPSPSSKLSSVTSSGGGGGDKEASKAGPLKLSDIGAEDKSSFKPYSKPGADKKDSSAGGGPAAASGGSSGGGGGGGEKSGFRVPSATCPPFTPRTGSPSSSASACSPGLLPGGESKGGGGGGGGGGEAEKKEAAESCGKGSSDGSGRLGASGGGLPTELSQAHEGAKGLLAGVASAAACSTSESSCSAVPSSVAAAASVLGSAGLVAPVSPYKPGQTVFPLPPAGMSYPGSLAGAYAGYPPQFLPPGVALDPSKAGSLGGGGGGAGGGKAAGSSPLAGASPPSVMTASLCRDPYCLSYHCASHLAAGASCAHEQALKAGGYPLVYPAPPLHAGPPSLAGHPLYPYGFLLPNDPQPHSCNWVSANGPCDKRFATSEELLSHLRTHTAFPGPAEKLLSGYPSSSSLAAAAAAAMACHMHVPSSAAAAGAPGSPGALALRSPHHALGLSSRYHPYSKSPLPTPGAPVPVPAATGPYYSPYALYGQRLTTASALGYQ
ncbi:zinc finger protein 503 [Candoia aspera]|uniref:zinc finger protein 503 n=1 Tax=Candoia aspera TaxID=51853 RepID=UPI002FD8004C